MTLALNFQGQISNLLYLREKWNNCHETETRHMISSEYWASNVAMNFDLGLTLTLNFQGQIFNYLWLYLREKWSDCHKTKKITYRLNSSPQIRPSILTLAIILTVGFQGKIFHLLHIHLEEKNDPIAKKRKQVHVYHLNVKHQNWPSNLNVTNSYGGDFRCWHANYLSS